MTEGGGAAPEPPDDQGGRNVENAVMLGFFVVLVAAGIWLLGTMADIRKVQDCAAAHDPPKCKRFGEKIMRFFKSLERDRTQNRIPFLLIALYDAAIAQRSRSPIGRDRYVSLKMGEAR